MTGPDIEGIEIDLLLEAIHRRYGLDFRGYARASVERRIYRMLEHSRVETISELIPRVLRDSDLFHELVQYFSITVSDMFRDPPVYRTIREKVFPYLRTYPFLKIWHAGCATGEEPYSMAIMLHEEKMYDRATLFATDYNENALRKAKEGIYDLKRARDFTSNYQAAGGKTSFADYYHARYGGMSLRSDLKRNITFANYNLVTDSAFGDMNLIMCRNVLIYFGHELQKRVLNLFLESLAHRGFLCLGTKESLRGSGVEKYFQCVDQQAMLYQKC